MFRLLLVLVVLAPAPNLPAQPAMDGPAPRGLGSPLPAAVWTVSSLADALPRAASGSPAMGQFVAGSLAGGLGAILGGFAGAGIDKRNCDHGDWLCGLTGALLGGTLGLTAGSTLGVYAVGRHHGLDGSFPATLGGSALGLVAAIGVMSAAQGPGAVAVLLFLTLPPAGALLGYTITARSRLTAFGLPVRVPDPLTRGQSAAWQASLLSVRW